MTKTLHPDHDDVTLLKLKQVVDRTTLSKAMIYRLMARGEFPQSISVSGSRVAWLKSDVVGWINDRVNRIRGAA